MLVFAPSRASAAFEAQERALAGHEAGMAERDLLLIDVFEEGPSCSDRAALSDAAADALRARFAPASRAFAAVLVGKDGTAKARFDAPVLPDELFARIDAMPMRRREMGEG